MKRISLLLLTVLFLNAPIMAQVNSFSQRGKVTQELKTEGFYIAHSSLPLNSKANIVNTVTGKAAEVTIIRRLAASTSRIADITSDVWQTLGLNPNTDVMIYTTASAKPDSAYSVSSAPVTSRTQINSTPPPPNYK